MRVVITGGNGFIGQRLCSTLSEIGYEVIIISRYNTKKTIGLSVRVVQLDYDCLATIESKLRELEPHIIIHLASSRNRLSFTHINNNDLSAELQMETNIILASAKLHDLRLFLNFGTADMLSTNGCVVSDPDALHPKTPYSWIKSSSTNLVGALNRSVEFPGTTLIPSLVYGPGQTQDMFVPGLIMSLLQEQEFEMTSGTQIRDMIYIEDLINLVISIIEKPGPLLGQNLLVGSGKSITVRKLAYLIANLIQPENKYLIKLGKLQNSSKIDYGYRFDMRKTFFSVNWRPKIELQDGLKSTINYFKESLY